MEQLVARILDFYGLECVSIGAAQKGYRNSSFPIKLKNGTHCNVIIYKNESGIVRRIKAAQAISERASKNGLPVRLQIDPRILTLSSSKSQRYAALYNWLPGATIPWEAYTMEHIKVLGATLSDLHAAVSDLESLEQFPDVILECRMLVNEMSYYFSQAGVQTAMKSKLTLDLDGRTFLYFIELLDKMSRLSGSQPLHMDFVRGNILFADPTKADHKYMLSGILDFEKAALGNPVFDVARTLAFLLVDCKYKPINKIKKYFIQSGYNKRGTGLLTPKELRFLEPLVTFFMFYDFYKFLLHNPYESLYLNEHFTRTRDQLIQRKILHQV